ncbi:hypothetical protein [Thermoclostridium stercorarium]
MSGATVVRRCFGYVVHYVIRNTHLLALSSSSSILAS